MIRAIVIAALLFLGHFAQAQVELRGSLGFGIITPDAMNTKLTQYGITNIYALGTGSLDALFYVPETTLGLGVRFERQGIKVGSVGSGREEADLSTSRLAVLGKYLFIDKLGQLGVVGTLGLIHKVKFDLKTPTSDLSYDSGTTTSASIGIEGGFKFGRFLLLGETGFQHYLIRDLSGGTSGRAGFDLNMGGPYAKLTGGFRF